MGITNYLKQFEKEVIITGFESGRIIANKKIVSLRPGKFLVSEIEYFLGKKFQYKEILAIDYYGFFKLSNGIYEAVASVQGIFPGIRTMVSPVVHFCSIKKDKIAQIAPHLVDGYAELKKHIVSLRWGKGV